MFMFNTVGYTEGGGMNKISGRASKRRRASRPVSSHRFLISFGYELCLFTVLFLRDPSRAGCRAITLKFTRSTFDNHS